MTRLLVARLQDILANGAGRRKLCILLGAGATVPFVPGVADLKDRALQFVDESAGPRSFRSDDRVVRPSAAQADRISQYADALDLVKRVRGNEGVRLLVQRAALEPYEGDLPSDFTQRPLSEEELGGIEADCMKWRIPPGLQALASIISSYGDRVCSHLLTTNFDVLLQVALRRAGITPATFAAHYNVSPAGMRIGHASRAVVHLHGDCRGETLHSPADIQRARPQLETWLAHHLQQKTLLVVGYSGWDDIIGRVLRLELDEGANDDPDSAVDVLWGVYEKAIEHSIINAELASFFRKNPQRVVPYYEIDRDQLFPELAETLAVSTPTPHRSTKSSKTQPTMFYKQIMELTGFRFGHSPIARTTEPHLIFWPHRLRDPHLIHGVHALTAILFSKLGIPVELHLDDIGVPEQRADDLSNRFAEAVHDWFSTCEAQDPPSIRRMSELLTSMNEADRATRLWALAQDFYSTGNYVIDTLLAAKAAETQGDRVTIRTGTSDRLLRPLYTWLALEDALDRRGLAKLPDAPVVTLGGRDERKMWDLWRSRAGAPSIASVYVPHLETPRQQTDLWAYPELLRDAEYGWHDLTTFLRQAQVEPGGGEEVLEWVYSVAVRLASKAARERVTLTFAGQAVRSWESMQTALRADPMSASRAMAHAVASWFHADPIDPA